MIALDTNVLVRYVIGHCAKAEKAAPTCTFDQRTAGSPLFRVLGSARP